MYQNILVIIMCVISIAAVIFGLWIENGDTSGRDNNDKDKDYLEEEQINEKN